MKTCFYILIQFIWHLPGLTIGIDLKNVEIILTVAMAGTLITVSVVKYDGFDRDTAQSIRGAKIVSEFIEKHPNGKKISPSEYETFEKEFSSNIYQTVTGPDIDGDKSTNPTIVDLTVIPDEMIRPKGQSPALADLTPVIPPKRSNDSSKKILDRLTDIEEKIGNQTSRINVLEESAISVHKFEDLLNEKNIQMENLESVQSRLKVVESGIKSTAASIDSIVTYQKSMWIMWLSSFIFPLFVVVLTKLSGPSLERVGDGISTKILGPK